MVILDNVLTLQADSEVISLCEVVDVNDRQCENQLLLLHVFKTDTIRLGDLSQRTHLNTVSLLDQIVQVPKVFFIGWHQNYVAEFVGSPYDLHENINVL